MNLKKALKLVQSYSDNSQGLLLIQYSRLLCFDLNIPYRSAREDYIMPMVEHRILTPVKDFSNYFVYSSKYKGVFH